MTQKLNVNRKVRVMLMLDPEVAKALRVKAAIMGCRGISEYITDFVCKQVIYSSPVGGEVEVPSE